MSRPRVWLVAVGPEGLDVLADLPASGLTALDVIAVDVDGPLLRRCPARRKLPLPRGFDRTADAKAREALRGRLARMLRAGDLVLVVGEAGEEGPVSLFAGLIRELGARPLVLAVSDRPSRGSVPPDPSGPSRDAHLIRDAVMREARALFGRVGSGEPEDRPAPLLDRAAVLEVLASTDAELAGLDGEEAAGGGAGWRPPSRGEDAAYGGKAPAEADEETDLELPDDEETDLEPHDKDTAPVDRVHFTVTTPAWVAPGKFFVLDLWAHLDAQRDEALERARKAAAGEVRSRSKGPVALARGTLLAVRLRIDGLEVDDPEDTLLWDGEIANASFPVYAPPEAATGDARGLASVHAGGLQVAKVHFAVRVEADAGGADAAPLASEAALHRRAFASYASADRDAVLGRIQGMQKIVPRLEVFLDVLSLRSGQAWAEELERVIPEHDVFYLFWSGPASRSRWVEREWRWALESRGLDFIDPVPLVSPWEVAPPPELASRHFNDWVLAFQSDPGDRA